MSELENAIREIHQMDSEIENYFRKDRSGENPRRPDYKAFINRVRAKYGRSLDSPIRADRDTATAVLDKLLTYERVWNGQFLRYADECAHERERQTFLDRAHGAIEQICKKTGKTVESDIKDTLGSQYDEIVRSGKKPSVFYNKATNSFSVKSKE